MTRRSDQTSPLNWPEDLSSLSAEMWKLIGELMLYQAVEPKDIILFTQYILIVCKHYKILY